MILQPEVVGGLPGQKGFWGWVGGWMRGNRLTGGDGLGKTLERERARPQRGPLKWPLPFRRALK